MQNLLKSAKQNLLKKFSYFLLNDYRPLSQYLFEKTFKVKFNENFTQEESLFAKEAFENLSRDELNEIIKLNRYDIELYNFGKKLFFERVKYFWENE